MNLFMGQLVGDILESGFGFVHFNHIPDVGFRILFL